MFLQHRQSRSHGGSVSRSEGERSERERRGEERGRKEDKPEDFGSDGETWVTESVDCEGVLDVFRRKKVKPEGVRKGNPVEEKKRRRTRRVSRVISFDVKITSVNQATTPGEVY